MATVVMPRRGRPEAPASQEERLQDLLRIVAKVAARDFSEKPAVIEGDDAVSQLTVAFRFMIEDLERALGEVERERHRLQRANERLQDLDQAKTRFINSAAHELRTPLTPIMIQLDLLRRGTFGALTEPQLGAVGVLDRNLERLTVLVRDLLDVSRLQANHLEIHAEPCDPAVLVRQCAETYSAMGEQRGILVRMDELPTPIIAMDPGRINQVLVNLVDNAIKFTPHGGEVHLSVGSDGDGVRLSVSDTGIGIAHKDIHKLFQPFSQIADPMMRTRAGTGLGLYISKGIVEAHGGRIRVESPGHGKGTTFHIWLPAHAHARPAPMAQHA